ncbi:ATP-binding protein [Sorangium sp. So ce1078]|uniref:AAA family ATPase n=1 Tax=Sorangium sp. So ce1078 TaxID=3133329 RepID=UPI003F5FBA4A
MSGDEPTAEASPGPSDAAGATVPAFPASRPVDAHPPFPWSKGNGLCKVLWDPLLWSRALKHSWQRKFFRAVFKRIDVVARGPHFSVDNDEQFGGAVISVMASQRAREKAMQMHDAHLGKAQGNQRHRLRSIMDLPRYLSHELWKDLAKQEGLPPAEAICASAQDPLRLDPVRFERWLAENPRSAEQALLVARYASLAAMNDPTLGPRLFAILSRNSAELASAAGDGAPSSQAPSHAPRVAAPRLAPPASSGAGSRPAPVENGAPPRPSVDASRPATTSAPEPPVIPAGAALSEELTELFRNWQGWQQLPLRALRAGVEELYRAAQSYQDRLQLLDELHSRVEKRLIDVAGIPWLPVAPPLEKSAAFVERDSLESANDRLSSLELRASRVLNAHLQLLALTERLSRTPAPIVRRGVADLDEIASRLEEEAARLRDELARKTQSEARAQEMLERFAVLDAAANLDDLVRDLTPAHWLDLAAFLGTSKHPKAALEGRIELAGIALALTWHTHPRETAELLEPLIVEGDRFQRANLLAYFNFVDLQRLADKVASLRGHLAELTFTAAVMSDQLEALDYLASFLAYPDVHPTCLAVYRAFCNQRRGTPGSLRALIRRDDAGAAATIRQDAARSQAHLLELVQNPPGMKGNYHRLRVLARAQYFSPLEDALRTGDVNAVARTWASYGKLDEMVEQCARASGRKDELEDTHYRQTRAYLAGFDEELQRWRRLGAPVRRTQTDDALAALRREVALARNDQCMSLQKAVDELGVGSTAPLGLAADFGRRCELSSNGVVSVVTWNVLVSPQMIFSWPRAVTDGVVPLSWFAVDRLRAARGVAPPDTLTAAQVYLRTNALLAARRAVQGEPEGARKVEEAIALKIDAIRHEHEPTLSQAHAARDQDEFIDLWLKELDAAFVSLDLDQAEKRIVELEELVAVYRLRTDPARLALVEFLREAGQEQVDDLTIEELTKRAEATRAARRHQRIHILELEDAARREVFSASLRESWSAFARRVDRPALWLNEELSLHLGMAVKACEKFMRGKLRYRDDDPATVDLLVTSLERWIPVRIKEAIEGDDQEAAAKPLLDLAEQIENNAPERSILRLVGEIAPQSTASASIIDLALRQGDPLGAQEPPRAERRERTMPPPVNVAPEIRRFLQEQAQREARLPPPSPEALRNAIHKKDWRSARPVGAALLLKDAESAEATLTGGEVAYAVALTHAPLDDEPEVILQVFRNASLASAWRGSDTSFYGLTPHIDALLPRALARVLGEDPNVAPERLPDLLAQLADTSPTDRAYRWIADLLATASTIQVREGTGSSTLAASLWNALTGVKDSARPRSNLLHMLYRTRRFEALRHLAHTARPFDDLISQCVTVFERAEVDPELRLPARQISSALYEQSRGRANTKPWTLLFARIEPSAGEMPGSAVTCSLDAATVGEEPDGIVVLPIRLVPSLDLPESLRIRIGGEGAGIEAEISVDEILVKETLILGRIPRAQLGPPGDVLDVPYRATGQTIRGNRIDVRGAWTVRIAESASAQPLHEHDLRLGWPGASGDPVTTAGNFHGRKREIKEVERYLLAEERQRSIMIFGQRRIGKTSLLCQMVASLPPGPGRVTAAFLDVSGLAIEKTSIAKRFFDLIIAALEADAKNEPIRAALQDRAEITHLARGLNPAASFSYALEALLDRMKRESRGAISRLALFIDEFDRFVEPLLADAQQRYEVEQLMWQIRQIVQHSESISLVLAGSGLQRLLVDDYAAPLFGSIDHLEIRPFDWGSDREAIEQTFLPLRARDRVCAKGAFPELARTAHQLSGGHPYYLTMLGYSAAMLSAGRPLTPASLSRIVDAMITGTVRASGPRIDAVRFYAPIFESLKRLTPRVQAIAKLILVQVAQRTTPEYPWLSIADGSAGADLRDTYDVERLDAFKALTGEGALEVDGRTGSPRVRIRIPLTASALRQDATLLREEGNRELRGGKS